MRPLLPITILACVLAFSACATAGGMPEGSTTITTNPSGARVFVNGAEVCTTTPCNWNEGDGLGQRYHLQVRKEGYQDIDFFLDKELRFFSGFFSVFAWRMPRQVQLTMATPPGAPVPPPPAPAAGPPAAKTPSL